ncbi:tetratricopeptide repeat protein [Inmirania thermothiophila]|uniref:Flp pilus assembly protein TadD n=1 Tax=Inmirania thermothiophila TaxID=1750597 RepID=A0A3N1Y8U4_9GAMM|nr:tetratricopeptide repeat protein [Inmirania thermothiophila]ROR34918.1 Flp pilus assembly protein TadD [Inmirania thermothiophila]
MARGDQELEQALALHRAGRAAEAAARYERLLGRRDDPHLRVLLGTALCQAGQWERGAAMLREVLAAHPDHVDALNNLGAMLLERDHLDEAAALLDRLLAHAPEHPQGLRNRAVVARRRDEPEVARTCTERLLAKAPDDTEAAALHAWALARSAEPEQAAAWMEAWMARHGPHAGLLQELGALRFAQGRHREATACFERAAGLEPENPEPLCNAAVAAAIVDASLGLAAYRRLLQAHPGHRRGRLGYANLLQRTGDYAEVERICREILAEDPGCVEAWLNLAAALRRQGRGEEAAAARARALEIAPDDPDVLSHLGVTMLEEGGDPAEAIAYLERAHHADPRHPAAGVNLSDALLHAGRFDESLAVIEELARHWPESAEVQWQRAIVLLLHGRLREGFAAYEARFRHGTPGFPKPPPDPVWDGRPLQGGTLLLHPEQGLGDTIQFARYLPLIGARGGVPVLPSPPALLRLFAASFPQARIVPAQGRIEAPACHLAMASLPHVFGTDLEGIPAEIPYLRAPEFLVEEWRRRLPAGPGLRVGICWAGNPTHRHDARRSVPAVRFARLGRIPGVTLYSLQKGLRGEEVAELRAQGIEVVDPTPDIGDMADTAAILMHLDLVVSVDTSVVHLAGALGRPVWTLLQHDCDWRWMLEREDSPWYPTMRLFRQPRPGDWDSVFERVEAALRDLVAARQAEAAQAAAAAGPWQGPGALLPAGARVLAVGEPPAVPLPEGTRLTRVGDEEGEGGPFTHLLVARAEDLGDPAEAAAALREAAAEVILGVPSERLEGTVQALLAAGLGVRAAERGEGRCYLALERRPPETPVPRRVRLLALDDSLPARMAGRLWAALLPGGTEFVAEGQATDALLLTGGLVPAPAEALAAAAPALPCAGAFTAAAPPARLRLRLALTAADAASGAVHLGVWPLAFLRPAPRDDAEGAVRIGPQALAAAPPETLAAEAAAAGGVVAVGPDAVLVGLAAAARMQWHPDPAAPEASARAVRALLVEVLGRAYPPGQAFPVDREAVRRYRERLAERMEAIRRGLAEVLAA